MSCGIDQFLQNFQIPSDVNSIISEYAIVNPLRLMIFLDDRKFSDDDYSDIANPVIWMCNLAIYDHAITGVSCLDPNSYQWHMLPSISSSTPHFIRANTLTHLVDNQTKLIFFQSEKYISEPIHVFDADKTMNWIPNLSFKCPESNYYNSGAGCLTSSYDSLRNQLTLITLGVDNYPGDSFTRIDIVTTSKDRLLFIDNNDAEIKTKEQEEQEGQEEETREKKHKREIFPNRICSISLDWHEPTKKTILYDPKTKHLYWIKDSVEDVRLYKIEIKEKFDNENESSTSGVQRKSKRKDYAYENWKLICNNLPPFDTRRTEFGLDNYVAVLLPAQGIFFLRKNKLEFFSFEHGKLQQLQIRLPNKNIFQLLLTPDSNCIICASSSGIHSIKTQILLGIERHSLADSTWLKLADLPEMIRTLLKSQGYMSFLNRIDFNLIE